MSADDCSAEPEGRVMVEYEIDPDGNAVDPRVVESEPSDVFNGAALKAIRGWKFEGTGMTQEKQRTVVLFRTNAACE